MKVLMLSLCLLLGACRKDEPPQPTAEESAELNDAEHMLNSMSNNEEGPEAKASGPSSSNN